MVWVRCCWCWYNRGFFSGLVLALVSERRWLVLVLMVVLAWLVLVLMVLASVLVPVVMSVEVLVLV